MLKFEFSDLKNPTEIYFLNKIIDFNNFKQITPNGVIPAAWRLIKVGSYEDWTIWQLKDELSLRKFKGFKDKISFKFKQRSLNYLKDNSVLNCEVVQFPYFQLLLRKDSFLIFYLLVLQYSIFYFFYLLNFRFNFKDKIYFKTLSIVRK